MSMVPRSFLFVPGTRPDRLAKALASGCDQVIVDLEDAVAPQHKTDARDAVAGLLCTATPLVLRINASTTPWHEDDARLAAHPGVAAVMLAKSEGPESLAVLRRVCAGKPVLALVETALGMARLPDLARSAGVARLVFGSIDLQFDLDIPEDDGDSLLWFRSHLVLASRLAGLPPPVDGVTVAIDDADQVARDARRARALGFGAKLCIHPRQVAAVNAAFTPSPAQLDWARRVVAAADPTEGAAVAVDGRMVDAPVLAQARRLLGRVPAP